MIVELTRARRTFLGDRLEEEGHTRDFEPHSIAEVVLAAISINLLKEVVILKALLEFHHGLATDGSLGPHGRYDVVLGGAYRWDDPMDQ